jgi:hypothetical protein
MQQPASSFRAWIVLLALVAITFGGTTGASFAFPLASRNDFNVVDWEMRHLPGKWLYLGGRLVKGRLSPDAEDAHVALLLDLSGRIDCSSAAVRMQARPKSWPIWRSSVTRSRTTLKRRLQGASRRRSKG